MKLINIFLLFCLFFNLVACNSDSSVTKSKNSNSGSDAFSVNSITVSSDSKKLIISGSNLDKVNSISILSSDKAVTLNQLQITLKTSNSIEASPSGQNLILENGNVVRVN